MFGLNLQSAHVFLVLRPSSQVVQQTGRSKQCKMFSIYPHGYYLSILHPFHNHANVLPWLVFFLMFTYIRPCNKRSPIPRGVALGPGPQHCSPAFVSTPVLHVTGVQHTCQRKEVIINWIYREMLVSQYINTVQLSATLCNTTNRNTSYITHKKLLISFFMCIDYV